MAVARAQRLLGDAEVTAAGVLPNPALVVQHQGSLAGPQERETTFGVSVSLGLNGRWTLLKEAAKARREQARAAASATLFEDAISFRRAYARAALSKARLDALVAEQASLESLSDTLEALAKGGERSPYDLLRQRAQARLHRQSVQSMRASAAAAHQWLQTWTDEEVVVPGDISSLLELAGGALPERALDSRETRRQHPLVRGFRAATRADSIEADAARRLWIPDPSVFVGYRSTEAEGVAGHGIALGLTLPLPFFDQGQGAARRAEASQQLSAARASSLERSQQASIGASRARLRQLEASVAVLDSAVTETASLRAKAQRLYSAGEASIAELLDAYRTTEEEQLSHIGAIEELVNTRLDLMNASGTQFNARLDEVCGSNQPEGRAR